MTRVTTTLLIMMVLMNGAVGIMASSGLSDQLGIDIAPGVSDNVDAAVETAQEGFSADAGLGETLFAVFMSALQTFSALINGIFALPQAMINIGFPAWIVWPIAMPLYIIATLEFIFIASGRRTL